MIPKLNWSLTANYPAGASLWSGQPVALAPPGTYWTPDLPVDSEELNYNFGTAASDLKALAIQIASAQVNNWCAEFNSVGGTAFSASPLIAMCWSPGTGKGLGLFIALLAGPSIGTGYLYVSYGQDGGTTAAWTILGGGTITFTADTYYGAVSVSGSNDSHWIVAQSDASSNVYLWLTGGASWTNVWTSTFPTLGSNFYGVQLVAFNGYTILAAASTDSANALLLSSNNDFSTLTLYSTGVAMASGSNWNLAASPSTAAVPVALAIPQSENLYTVYRTTDGHTWTSSASLAGLVAANSTIVGLAWAADAAGPCWVACAQPASGLPVFYRSSDGITWTAQAGGVTTSGTTVADLAAQGSTLIATSVDTGGGTTNLMFSLDGGVTWYNSQGLLTTSQAGGNGFIPGTVVASDCGFVFFNNKWARFSLNVGTPPVAL